MAWTGTYHLQTVILNGKMTESAFHSKYVAPFYMDLMNMNFLSKSAEETESLFNSLQLISKDLDDSKLAEMLNDSWRVSKVAAWIIGISGRTDLVTEIESFLSKKGICYSEHALINLLILKDRESVEPLNKFVEQQIDYLIGKDTQLDVDTLSIDWAVSIIGYLDKVNGTKELNHIYESDKWSSFEYELKRLPFYQTIKASYEPTYHENKLAELMQKLRRG